MYAAVESLVPDKAFTIFTGDVVEGAVWLVTGMPTTVSLTIRYLQISQTLKSPTTSKMLIPV